MRRARILQGICRFNLLYVDTQYHLGWRVLLLLEYRKKIHAHHNQHSNADLTRKRG